MRCGVVLRTLDLSPPAMPPHAILCIRAMPDPLPDGIDMRPGRPRQHPLAWELAMRAALGAMLQHAARPMEGPVGSDVDAVLFTDEAEMLACAARDICRGPLSWFWWWRHLLPAASMESVVAAWRDAPTYMPAAFESLMRIGDAAPWIRTLTPSSASALLDAMLRAYALPAFAEAIGAVSGEVDAPDARPHAIAVPRNETAPPAAHRPAPRSSNLPSPWRGVVPAAWEQLSAPLVSRTFAAMCIVLRRSPALPRTEGFSRAVVSYLRNARRAEHREDATVSDTVRYDELHGQSPVTASAPGWSDVATIPESPRLASAIARRPATNERSADESRASDSDDVLPMLAARRRRSISPQTLAGPVADSRNASLSSLSPSHPLREASLELETPVAAEQPPVADVEAVESEYAGAFFLINVAIDLKLYSHGITVVDDLPLSIWRFVELVARECLGEHDANDPLWKVLRDLADPSRDPELQDGAPDLLPGEHARLVGRVHMHLESVFEVDDPGGLLIRRRGRITRTPGHLDVGFSLERHPIEIRAASLDRNPGWTPAAGVHVGFHFD
ncbi:MAG TPA: hypothetical protein VKE96_03030 [Vicinamibacterales bacterium]|nr:hypothetical protein [Vicinamibacterales bacterium]